MYLHRYQYYLQLKKDVLEGRIPCSIEQAIRLAGLTVQGNVNGLGLIRETFDKERLATGRSDYGTLLIKSLIGHGITTVSLLSGVIFIISSFFTRNRDSGVADCSF